MIHGDQHLAGVIFTYQTTLQVTRILVLIVAWSTPSPQGILYLVLTVNSMLEATNSRQQISNYSMKQPHKELYPELLTLCFSLLLFVCLWRYDFKVTQFQLLRHPSIQLSLFFTSHHPSRPYLSAPLGTKPSSFTLGSLLPACRRLLFPLCTRKRDVCVTPSLIVFQRPAGFPRYWEHAVIGWHTLRIVWLNADWLFSNVVW